jgi:hypothetical protein
MTYEVSEKNASGADPIEGMICQTKRIFSGLWVFLFLSDILGTFGVDGDHSCVL